MLIRLLALLLVAAFIALVCVIGSIPLGYWEAQHGFMAHPELGYPGGIKP